MVRLYSDVLNMKNAFYFALPRLLNRMRGGTDEVSESNAAEAYLGSIGIFIITFVFGLQLLAERFSGWSLIVSAAVLVFAVWIFWLAIFYINSIFIKGLRACSLFRVTPNRRAQDFFIGIVVAATSYRLSILHGWPGWIGWLCLCALVANFIAAILLKLIPNTR
jgi:hypothetical protein